MAGRRSSLGAQLLVFSTAAALSAGLGGCARSAASGSGSNSPARSASTPDPFAAPRATADHGYYVRCTPSPQPIPVNQVFSMQVSVCRDADFARPASGVGIHADADMPEHGHGMTLSPRVARVGDGVFRVEGMLMHMPGAWEIYIDVQESGRTSRAVFPVEVQ